MPSLSYLVLFNDYGVKVAKIIVILALRLELVIGYQVSGDYSSASVTVWSVSVTV